ncbi:MAG: PQQ-binding-like beta-propeller repeat protein [Phycisphaerae bacterium]|nr:PQQ-binding-like beta-propeller repeat protein [Phycisphaerae bacterium]
MLLPFGLVPLLGPPTQASDQTPPDTQPAGQTLEPYWTWQMQPGVEWVELVGASETTALLAATRDAQLHLLDPASGQARFSKPIPVGRGARAAFGDEHTEHPSDIAYCFDRHALYAIRLSKPAGLKWQHGETTDPAAFPGDPEVLTGWTAAVNSSAGLVAVNADGRIVLLSHADGKELWTINLGFVSNVASGLRPGRRMRENAHLRLRPGRSPDATLLLRQSLALPLVRLHVFGNKAVVLWKAGGQVKAAFIVLSDKRPRPTIRALAEPWSLWSTLIGDELLTVSSNQVTLWRESGPRRSCRLEGEDLRASAIDVFIPPTRNDACPASSSTPPPLLLIGGGYWLSAYSLSSGEKVWPKHKPRRSDSRIFSLTIRGSNVIAIGQKGIYVYDVATGVLLGHCRAALGREFIAAGLSERYLYGLVRTSRLSSDMKPDPRDSDKTRGAADFSPRGARGAADFSPRGARRAADFSPRGAAQAEARGSSVEARLYTLHRVPLCGPTAQRPPLDSTRFLNMFHLQPSGDIRQVLWPPGYMILVEPNGLRAYTLPRSCPEAG